MENKRTYYSLEKLGINSNPSFVNKMIELFIKTSNEYILNISMAIDENDLMKINQLAHYIKPSIDLMNIEAITQSIRFIEQATIIDKELMDIIDFTNKELRLVVKQMQNDYA